MDWLFLQELPKELLTDVAMTLGLLITAALLAGALGDILRLPKVTSYLLIGVLLGPWIPKQHVEQAEPLVKLAIALVLFNLGCHFPLTRARRILYRVLRLSLGELGLTFVLVSVGLIGIGLMTGGIRADGALLLGALALATAPATTILMLKETESEGTVTEYTQALVAVNNLVAILAFEIVFAAVLLGHGQLKESLPRELGYLAQDLFGSLALGFVAGLIVSASYPLVAESRRLILLVGIITLVLGICLGAEMPYLLTFLAMGATVANSSDQTRRVMAELDRLTGLLCVIFFVVHGAQLEIDLLWKVGWIGAGYLVLRSCGKYFGIRLGMRGGHEEPVVGRWLGATLLAQAGAAIALSVIAVDRTAAMEGTLHGVCLNVQAIILGTVVVFEIAGPLLIRQAVLRAGEVPVAHAIHHSSIGVWEQMRTVLNRLLLALGIDPWGHRMADDLTIGDMMRRNISGLPLSATFDETITHIEHSRDNTFPVVDRAGILAGVIRYRELSGALFDRSLGSLVRATDMTTPAGRTLFPDEPLAQASAIFSSSKDDCIVVIAREPDDQYLGIVRRRDILRLLIRRRPS